MSLTPEEEAEATIELVLAWVRNFAEHIDELRTELEADIRDLKADIRNLKKLQEGAR